MPLGRNPAQGRRLPRLLDAAELADFAIKTLGRRALSVSELRLRLLARAQQPEDAENVIAKMKEYGYLDDQRFAQSFAAGRLENRGFGRLRVLRDLRARRIPPPVADAAVQETFADQNEVELVQNFLQRKYRNIDLQQFLQEEKNLAAAFRRLRYAGFKGTAAIQVLLQYSRRAQELEDDAGGHEAES